MTEKEQVNNGSLATTLISTLKKIQSGQKLTDDENASLAATLNENIEFIKNMAAQDRKSLMRQIVSLDKDLFMDTDALTKAREKGVISEDLHQSINNVDTFEAATKGQERRRENIWEHILSLSNIDSVMFKTKAAIEIYNSAVEDKHIKKRRPVTEVSFDLNLQNMPDHRLDETVVRLLEFDFVKRGIDGNPEHIRGIDNEDETNDVKIRVVKNQSYDKGKKKLYVSLKVFEDTIKRDENGKEIGKDTKPSKDYSILIDQDKTIENLRRAIEKIYVVKSSIIKNDFKDEGELLENLYFLPLNRCLASIGEEVVTDKVTLVVQAMEQFKAEVRKIDIALAKGKGKKPLFDAWLSIVEGNTSPITGSNETQYRIPKSSVVDKYFSGDTSKYDLTISEGTPTQSALERRVWLYRVDLGTEGKPNKIDFLLTTYGMSRTKIWVPIDKDFICPIAFKNEFERSAITNRKKFKKGQAVQQGKTTFATVSTSNMDFSRFGE